MASHTDSPVQYCLLKAHCSRLMCVTLVLLCVTLVVLLYVTLAVFLCVILVVDNLPLALRHFGVVGGSRLKADDFLQNYQLVLMIQHRYCLIPCSPNPYPSHPHHKTKANAVIRVVNDARTPAHTHPANATHTHQCCCLFSTALILCQMGSSLK